MIVNGQEYKDKTFIASCGEITVNSYGVRGDYQLDLTIDPNPEVLIYRDSLSVTYHKKEIEHNLTGEQTKISSKKDLMLFLDVWQPIDIPSEDNFVRVNFNGVFYCDNQKVSIDEILIDRFQ